MATTKDKKGKSSSSKKTKDKKDEQSDSLNPQQKKLIMEAWEKSAIALANLMKRIGDDASAEAARSVLSYKKEKAASAKMVAKMRRLRQKPKNQKRVRRKRETRFLMLSSRSSSMRSTQWMSRSFLMARQNTCLRSSLTTAPSTSIVARPPM